MKTKKKVLCALVAVVLVLSITVSVWAASINSPAYEEIHPDPVPAAAHDGAEESEGQQATVAVYPCGGTFPAPREAYATLNVTLGEGRTMPNTEWCQPVRSGYRFLGWYAEDPGANVPAGKEAYTEGKTVPEETTALYAGWVRTVVLDAEPGNFWEGEQKENNYTRTVDLNEGKLPDELPSPVYDYTKDGSAQEIEFCGWFTEKTTMNKVADGDHWNWSIHTNGAEVQPGAAVEEGVTTLYAGYKIKEGSEKKVVTYYYDWNGVDGMWGHCLTSSRSYSDEAEGYKLTAGDLAIRYLNWDGEQDSKFENQDDLDKYWKSKTFNGYTFLGWAKNPTDETPNVFADTVIKNGDSIYAVWTKADGTNSWTFDRTDPKAGPLEWIRFDCALTQRTHPENSLSASLFAYPTRSPLKDANVVWTLTVPDGKSKTVTYTSDETEALKAKGITVALSEDLKTLTVTYDDGGKGEDCAVTVSAKAQKEDGTPVETNNTVTLSFSHDWDKGETTGKATCTEGVTTTYHCQSCDDVKIVKGAELGHTYDSRSTRGVRIVKEATCTTPGIKHLICLRCGTERPDDYVIAALGHSWSTKTEAVSCNQNKVTKTCDTCGAKEETTVSANNPGLHKWVESSRYSFSCIEDQVVYTCSTCGKRETRYETASHEDRHSWGSWKTTKSSTTTSEGESTRSCNVCGKQEKKSLPMINEIKVSSVTKTVSTESQTFDLGAKANGGAKLTYTSNNKSVTVSSAGKVTVQPNFAGTASITVKSAATADYNSATKIISVTVKKAANSITASNVTKTASSKAQTFSLGAKVNGGAKLTYTSDNKSITVDSTGKVTVKANYSGKATITVKAASTGTYDAASKSITVTVSKAKNTITASNVTKTASSKSQTFSLGAKVNGSAKLTYSSNNKSITVNSSGNVTVKANYSGKATITIKAAATDTYESASKTVTVTVNKAKNTITVSSVSKTSSSKSQTFSLGAKVKGSAKLTYSSNNTSVTVNSSGKVTVKANFVGKATITVKAASTGVYDAASKSVTVTVNPAGATLSSVKNASGKKLTVTWKKNTAVTGYEIQYSTDKNFKSGVKSVSVTKNSTTSKTISSLTKNKTYYVRIRTYKTVSGTKYYSSWSSAKNVKITK